MSFPQFQIKFLISVKKSASLKKSLEKSLESKIKSKKRTRVSSDSSSDISPESKQKKTTKKPKNEILSSVGEIDWQIVASDVHPIERELRIILRKLEHEKRRTRPRKHKVIEEEEDPTFMYEGSNYVVLDDLSEGTETVDSKLETNVELDIVSEGEIPVLEQQDLDAELENISEEESPLFEPLNVESNSLQNPEVEQQNLDDEVENFTLEQNLNTEIENPSNEQQNLNARVQSPNVEQQNFNAEIENPSIEQQNLNLEPQNFNNETENPSIKHQNLNAEVKIPNIKESNLFSETENSSIEQPNINIDTRNFVLDSHNLEQQYLDSSIDDSEYPTLEMDNSSIEPVLPQPEDSNPEVEALTVNPVAIEVIEIASSPAFSEKSDFEVVEMFSKPLSVCDESEIVDVTGHVEDKPNSHGVPGKRRRRAGTSDGPVRRSSRSVTDDELSSNLSSRNASPEPSTVLRRGTIGRASSRCASGIGEESDSSVQNKKSKGRRPRNVKLPSPVLLPLTEIKEEPVDSDCSSVSKSSKKPEVKRLKGKKRKLSEGGRNEDYLHIRPCKVHLVDCKYTYLLPDADEALLARVSITGVTNNPYAAKFEGELEEEQEKDEEQEEEEQKEEEEHQEKTVQEEIIQQEIQIEVEKNDEKEEIIVQEAEEKTKYSGHKGPILNIQVKKKIKI